jgi:hypothetical protein|tara:strand:- start:206 stop:1030 length:825 start_codon:yes stop_codon:yes gene_type:complete
MNPKEYKDMMSHLTRPDTRPPEVQKAAAEKQFNSELDRKNKLKKSYDLQEDTSPVMYNPPSNSFKTENELKKEFDQESMKSWVKNTTALNENPGAFKKEVKASEAIENQPGYKIEQDPNLLRRIKLYSSNDLGPGFDTAIAAEDAELKKLGRDPLTILQRNNIKKYDSQDKSSYPSNPEQKRKLMAQQKLEKEKPFTKIANNLGKKPIAKAAAINLTIPSPDFTTYEKIIKKDTVQPNPAPQRTVPYRVENDPKYSKSIFGSDVFYRRRKGLDE